MKATELLLQQHRAVEDLFEQFEEAESTGEKRAIFEKLAANLVGHDAIEREIFYPACERELGEDDDVLGESLVEHGVVEFCLFRADQNQESEDFDKYVTVLEEAVQHHVEEEEKELLPKVKRELGSEMSEELGAKMEQRFQAALASDFREPLLENLNQVLEGKTKTQKKPEPRGSQGKANSRTKHARSDARAAKRRPRRTQGKRRGR